MAAGVARGNRLLPVLASVVVLMALYVGFKTLLDSGGVLQNLMADIPSVPDPDADTPAETIRTLTAKVADMTTQLEALREENAALSFDKEDMRRSLHDQLMSDWRTQQDQQRQKADNGIWQSMANRIDQLTNRVAAIDLPANTVDVPVGFGLQDSQSMIWIEPLDVQLVTDNTAGNTLLRPVASRQVGQTLDLTDTTIVSSDDQASTVPYYTIPVNSTLIGSTGWTALVGRIPINGNVQDPYPFKLIVGTDNLAANGINIPNVAGMIFSGTAIGDWNLSCVSGELNAVTFVFSDGTVRTITSDNTASTHLGWISDEQGIPCVSGELITNAAAYLTNRIGVGAIEAAAQAAAAAETTTSVSPTFGTGTSSVTGDIGRFVLGRTVAGGAREVREWLDARMGQSFDAVFVPAGYQVAIHIDEELRIDYDPNGRRIDHGMSTAAPSRRAYLD